MGVQLGGCARKFSERRHHGALGLVKLIKHADVRLLARDTPYCEAGLTVLNTLPRKRAALQQFCAQM
jgi:hypothetical protein